MQTKKLEVSEIDQRCDSLPKSMLTQYIQTLKRLDVGFDVYHETEEGRKINNLVVVIQEPSRGVKLIVQVNAGYTSEFTFNDWNGDIHHVSVGVQQTYGDDGE